MQILQTVILVDEFKNLRDIVAALADAKAEESDRVVVVCHSENVEILQEIEQLELLERYARRFGVKIILSAPNNVLLRQMASQVGWQVLWEAAELDALVA